MEGADDMLAPEEGLNEEPGTLTTRVSLQEVPKVVKKAGWALRSVLKVFVTRVDPNYAQPWQKCPQRSATGSGFVLDVHKHIIVTNAHVVANAVTVYVRRPGDPKKWLASICCISKQSDLALLTVAEEAFWTDLRPLEFLTEMPELQSPIAVAGYPFGGDSLSITKGIVSRVAMARYGNTGRLLAIQIDAAINSGNSGGPAFADIQAGKVAGVAFSKSAQSNADNIGYIIPYCVVQHFLSEYLAHGSYNGIVGVGFFTQPMENPAQQRYLKMPPGASGCTIMKLEPTSEAAKVLQVADVIMEVEGVPIAADESIPFRDDERIEYYHLISMKHVGDMLSLKILRDGQSLNVSYELKQQQHLVGLIHEVDCLPSYYITGGLVFAPLSWPLLEAMYGARKWRTLAVVSILQAFQQQKTNPYQQVVILVQILSHEINHGYKLAMLPVETFNRTSLHNLAHLAHLVDTSDDPYLNFGLDGGRFITLDRQQVLEHTPNILKINNIPCDRSEDLTGDSAAAAAQAGQQEAAAQAAAAAAAAAASPPASHSAAGADGNGTAGDMEH